MIDKIGRKDIVEKNQLLNRHTTKRSKFFVWHCNAV